MIVREHILYNPYNEIEMPKDTQVLSAGYVDGDVVIWALQNPFMTEYEIRVFEILRTDMNIDGAGLLEEAIYVGSVIDQHNSAVHVFEIRKRMLKPMLSYSGITN